MEDKPKSDASLIIMEEARQSQAQGEPIKALLLALEALVEALNYLKSSLAALQQGRGLGQARRPSLIFEEQPRPAACLVSEKKPPALH